MITKHTCRFTAKLIDPNSCCAKNVLGRNRCYNPHNGCRGDANGPLYRHPHCRVAPLAKRATLTLYHKINKTAE